MNMGIRRKKDILELVSKRKKETKQQVTSYKLGGVNKMKTMLRFLVMFAVALPFFKPTLTFVTRP